MCERAGRALSTALHLKHAGVAVSLPLGGQPPPRVAALKGPQLEQEAQPHRQAGAHGQWKPQHIGRGGKRGLYNGGRAFARDTPLNTLFDPTPAALFFDASSQHDRYKREVIARKSNVV